MSFKVNRSVSHSFSLDKKLTTNADGSSYLEEKVTGMYQEDNSATFEKHRDKVVARACEYKKQAFEPVEYYVDQLRLTMDGAYKPKIIEFIKDAEQATSCWERHGTEAIVQHYWIKKQNMAVEVGQCLKRRILREMYLGELHGCKFDGACKHAGCRQNPLTPIPNKPCACAEFEPCPEPGCCFIEALNSTLTEVERWDESVMGFGPDMFAFAFKHADAEVNQALSFLPVTRELAKGEMLKGTLENWMLSLMSDAGDSKLDLLRICQVLEGNSQDVASLEVLCSVRVTEGKESKRVLAVPIRFEVLMCFPQYRAQCDMFWEKHFIKPLRYASKAELTSQLLLCM